MKIKTRELIGPALDLAVAKCEGYDRDKYMKSPDIRKDVNNKVIGIMVPNNRDYIWFRPSTDWALAGPIIERERICVGWAYPRTVTKETQAVASYFEPIHAALETHRMFGPTPLIAAMRCYVASKLGDEVEVPEELK